MAVVCKLVCCMEVRPGLQVALQWTEVIMVRWMCDVKVKHRVSSVERVRVRD